MLREIKAFKCPNANIYSKLQIWNFELLLSLYL